MPWRRFHDPDVCLPVVARRATEYALDMLAGIGEILATRGRCLTWNRSGRDGTLQAYYSAVARLRKSGLVASRGKAGRAPLLVLTPAGEAELAWGMRPERFWNREWDGIWYVLTYDVPESHRSYREALRGFLQRLRLGCLQRSVWVTTRDIRPEYDDLAKGADIERFSHLFEARSVLGRRAEDIVEQAWDFRRLARVQQLYLDVFEDNLSRLYDARAQSEDLIELAADEAAAYRSAMAEDPLLPRRLWPADYLGSRVCELHRRCVGLIADRL